MKIYLVYRAEVFSPNSVTKDKAILDAVGHLLEEEGMTTHYIDEERIHAGIEADIVLTMARLPQSLAVLSRLEDNGVIVMNSVRGVTVATRRTELRQFMERLHVPVAPCCQQRPDDDGDGYWLKRGDAPAQGHTDVVFAKTWEDVERVRTSFTSRGIGNILVERHVKGDVVKFYGIEGTGFFRYYYPTDDGMTKFGDEEINGPSHHYPFNIHELASRSELLAKATGINVFGGDCIVRADGSYAIIDFNDWPSFARCREEAARAIVRKVKTIYIYEK